MQERHPFWSVVEGKRPPGPDALALGATIIEAVADSGQIAIRFDATSLPTQILGHISGGFVAAMLDLTASLAPATTYAPDEYGPTLELKASFLRPAPPGIYTGHGRTIRRSKSVAFVEAQLVDAASDVVATASSTLHIVRR